MNHKNVGIIGISLFVLTTLQAQDAKFAADNLKYSRDFYSKVHFVAIANLNFGAGGTAEFKYDRYPNGGPERVQAGDGTFARKDGKTWLISDDWGETGKPADAQTFETIEQLGGVNRCQSEWRAGIERPGRRLDRPEICR